MSKRDPWDIEHITCLTARQAKLEADLSDCQAEVELLRGKLNALENHLMSINQIPDDWDIRGNT